MQLQRNFKLYNSQLESESKIEYCNIRREHIIAIPPYNTQSHHIEKGLHVQYVTGLLAMNVYHQHHAYDKWGYGCTMHVANTWLSRTLVGLQNSHSNDRDPNSIAFPSRKRKQLCRSIYIAESYQQNLYIQQNLTCSANSANYQDQVMSRRLATDKLFIDQK